MNGRRRAAQLARHYRDQENLTIAEIGRRLGRAEATVKAYLYNPTYANKRPTDNPQGKLSAPRQRLGSCSGPSASQIRGMKILNGRDPRSGRVLALTGHRGFLLWRTQSGTPFWTMGFEPVLFRWRPLRLARVRCERESVCVVRPLVLHPHARLLLTIGGER